VSSKKKAPIIIVQEEEAGHAAAHGGSWKVAYADFVTGMMAFFLLMWLTAALSPKTKAALSNYFNDPKIASSRGMEKVIKGPTPNYGKDIAPGFNLSAQQQKQMEVVVMIKELVANNDVLKKNSGISSDTAGVLLQVNNSIMFPPGGVTLTAEAKKVLDGVAKILLEQKVDLVVRGHTDDVETGGSQYPTNWELSAGRAAAAVFYISKQGIKTSRLRVSAYGDSLPIVPNSSEENRKTNRRVEFYFHSPEMPAW
jgi:chemotaxis protein MotB